jgi:hypothetical protein
MQIRFIKKWKTYIRGDHTIINDIIGRILVNEGIAIDESDLHKSMDYPEKDKMIKSNETKRK